MSEEKMKERCGAAVPWWFRGGFVVVCMCGRGGARVENHAWWVEKMSQRQCFLFSLSYQERHDILEKGRLKPSRPRHDHQCA